MISAVRKLLRGDNDVKTLVQQYNKDLSAITNKIHHYETRSKNNVPKCRKVRSATAFYYLTLLFGIASYIYMKYSPSRAVLCIVIGLLILILIQIGIKRFFLMLNHRYETRLSALRSLHQDKMEELKQKTNFYHTNSLIQRFSSGDSGSDDMMLLMDDEVKQKRDQLDKLKADLESLRENKQQQGQDLEAREKWFDKALGILSGGDDVQKLPPTISLIVCPQCKATRGCYSVFGVPFEYVCPNCGFKLVVSSDEVTKGKPTLETGEEQSLLQRKESVN